MKSLRITAPRLILASSVIVAALFLAGIPTAASAASPPTQKTVWAHQVSNHHVRPSAEAVKKAIGKPNQVEFEVDRVRSTSIFSFIGNNLTKIHTKIVLLFSRIWHSVTPGGGNTCA